MNFLNVIIYLERSKIKLHKIMGSAVTRKCTDTHAAKQCSLTILLVNFVKITLLCVSNAVDFHTF
jgi:hypothetical protein